MNGKQNWRSGLALGGLTAAVALLVGLSQAQAQAPAPSPPLSGAGSFPNSFIVPGTNTSIHIGGVAQLSIWYDTSAFNNAPAPGASDHETAENGISLQGPGIGTTATEGHTNHGTVRITPEFSKIFVETRTPSEYGEIKTYVELNFSGSSTANGTTFAASSGTIGNPITQNSSARLTQAYGTLGPWLFGMTVSNFADLDAWPDTLDAPFEAGGYMGVADDWLPEVRYTQLFPNGISAAFSLENYIASGIFSEAGGAAAGTWNNFNGPGDSENLPAFVGTARIDQPWGHAAFHAAVAEDRFVNLVAPGTAGFPSVAELPIGGHVAAWGYQLSFTGHLNTIGLDKFTWQLQYGKGAGQYNFSLENYGSQWIESFVCTYGTGGTNSITCSQPRSMGANIGYSHHWNANWRTGIGLGYSQISLPSSADSWGDTGLFTGVSNALADLSRKQYSGTINLLWTPVPNVQLGIEYEYMKESVWSGAHGVDNRINSAAVFRF